MCVVELHSCQCTGARPRSCRWSPTLQRAACRSALYEPQRKSEVKHWPQRESLEQESISCAVKSIRKAARLASGVIRILRLFPLTGGTRQEPARCARLLATKGASAKSQLTAWRR